MSSRKAAGMSSISSQGERDASWNEGNVKLDLHTHGVITTGGCIVLIKAVKKKREQDENISEDNSSLQQGDSHMHRTVTKQHHLDRVKTSEVTMAMCSFVRVCAPYCVCYATVLPHHLLVVAFGIMNSLWITTPGPASAHCVFIILAH